MVLLSVVAAPAAERKLNILTTFLPGYCFCANVAGDRATVGNLLPGNASPHDYQLSPSDIRKFASADLIVVNGLGLESFLERAIANAGPGAREKVVTLSDGLAAQLIPWNEKEQSVGAEGSRYDPHIWLDPVLATHCVSNVVRALQKADPANSAAYAANGAAYSARLNQLNTDLTKELLAIRSVPFITYHSAFRYFARRYELKLAGVVEQAPELPPAPRKIRELLEAIRTQKAKALFTEPESSPRLARQIARDASIQTAELDPIETGALQPSQYEEAMRQDGQILLQTLR